MVNILKNQKQFAKFCKRFNSEFKCRRVFGCNISCPLWFAKEVQFMTDTKNMPLGEAFRLCMRSGISKPIAENILQEIFGMSLEEIRRKLNA